MFCSNCGAQIDDRAMICPKCGIATSNYYHGSGPIDPAIGYDWLTTLLLCFFLGGFGVHSFYTRKTGIAILQLFTLGGFGIWALVDLIMIATGDFKDGFGRPLIRR